MAGVWGNIAEILPSGRPPPCIFVFLALARIKGGMVGGWLAQGSPTYYSLAPATPLLYSQTKPNQPTTSGFYILPQAFSIGLVTL